MFDNLTPTVRNLLLFTVLVFLAQTYLAQVPVTELGSLYPITSPFFHFWQFGTYMFMHGSWGHLFGNMFGLFIFGPMLEQRWGGQRFLVFWLLCGLGAGILYEGVQTYQGHQTELAYADYRANPEAFEFNHFMQLSGLQDDTDESLAQAFARNPRDPELRLYTEKRVTQVRHILQTEPVGGMLGASGALFGVLFAFAYLFPNTIIYLYFALPVKAKYLVFFYTLYEIYRLFQQAPGDHVAHLAHIGGLLIGFIIVKYWESGRARFY